jgi:hypothetical protein
LLSPNIMISLIKSRRTRCEKSVGNLCEMRNAFGVLIGKPETGQHDRPRRRWGDNIKYIYAMDVKAWLGSTGSE